MNFVISAMKIFQIISCCAINLCSYHLDKFIHTDLSDQLIEHSENPNMLQAVKRYAIEADLGLQDMKFEVKSTEMTTADQLPADRPAGIIAVLKQFAKALSDDPDVSERKLQMGEVKEGTTIDMEVGPQP